MAPDPAGPISIALYQPDIAANMGSIARLGACMGVAVHIIEPAGFAWSHAALRRAGMDYLEHIRLVRHDGWRGFRDAMAGRRIVLATTRGTTPYHRFAFATGDILLFGRESAGVPGEVHERADGRIIIPMRAGMRSLNVAMAAAIMTTEALRQLDAMPG